MLHVARFPRPTSFIDNYIQNLKRDEISTQRNDPGATQRYRAEPVPKDTLFSVHGTSVYRLSSIMRY